jgi:hypothetical protein
MYASAIKDEQHFSYIDRRGPHQALAVYSL